MRVFALLAVALWNIGAASADALKDRAAPAEILEASSPSDWRTLDPENLLYIDLEHGRVTVALSTQLAQNHVAHIKALAREGFYDGLSFYRVIDGFVAQGGDVLEARKVKNAAETIVAEFDQPLNDAIAFNAVKDADGYSGRAGFVGSLPAGVDMTGETVWHLHCPGAIAMARDTGKHTAGTDFYIALQAQRYLDRNLTVFGRVVEGMEHLQALRRVAPAQSEDDDLGERILTMRVAADLPENEQAPLQILDSSKSAFQDYVESRRNRPEEFFYFRPDYIDVCALPIPVRPAPTDQD